jgi:hypothetical protein
MTVQPRFAVFNGSVFVKAFWTRAAALAWMPKNMRLVVLPKDTPTELGLPIV